MNLLYPFFLMALSIGAFQQANKITPQDLTNGYPYVDELITDLLVKTQVAGIAVSVDRAGELIYSKGFGFAELGKKIKMQPTSQIRTASVAKVITATALGKLATEGKLDWDTPIKAYIPYVKEPYASLTTRQIAGHTAGIQHRPSSRKLTNKHYNEIRPTVAFFQDDPLLFKPNTAYKYSTLGYNLLAALIEEVSGKRYADYMQEEIFMPLQMTQTFPEDISKLTEQDAASYYLKNGKLLLDKKLQDGSYKLAGAAFRSTSQDLVKMMRAYSNGFIAEEVVQKMFTSHVLTDSQHTNVGIGWRLNKDINGRSTSMISIT